MTALENVAQFVHACGSLKGASGDRRGGLVYEPTTARLILPLLVSLAGCGSSDLPTGSSDPPIPVATTVTISPPTLNFSSFGETQQLSAAVADQNGATMSGASVTWASSASSVASVSTTGLVESVANGTATITATSSSVSGAASVVVQQVATTLTLSATTVSFASLLDTHPLTATVRDQNGARMSGAPVSWTSSNTQVATVSPAGVVTALSNGSTTIRATSGSASGSASVTVEQVAASLALSTTSIPFTALGDTVRLTATVADGGGTAIPGATATWESSDGAVATVSSTGLVTAVGNGSAMITARSGPASGSASITVAQSPADLIPGYPYVSAIDEVLVGSDISQAFSDQHVDHMKEVWDYFSGIWAKRRSDRLEWYYSQDRSKVLAALELCSTQAVNAEARLLTACYGGTYPIWFIEPFVIPDFGTQLHEMGHDFVFPTYWGSASFPWFIEGSGMYYEGGVFQSDGSLALTQPLPWLVQTFDRYDGSGQLVALDTLVRLNRDQFYLGETPHAYYAQSGFFWYYLETRHSSVVDQLIAELNGVDPWVRNNQWVLDFIVSGTGLTLAELDQAYLALARSF